MAVALSTGITLSPEVLQPDAEPSIVIPDTDSPENVKETMTVERAIIVLARVQDSARKTCDGSTPNSRTRWDANDLIQALDFAIEALS
jgi:hypothetical protein